MASEEHADVSIDLPPDLQEWLDQQAESTDQSRDDLLREFLGAYRSMAENGVGEDVLTEADLSSYATEDDLDDVLTQADLDDVVTEDDVDEHLTADDLDDVVTEADVEDHVTTDELADLVTKDELADLVTTDDLDEFVTAADLEAAVASAEFDGVVGDEELDDRLEEHRAEFTELLDDVRKRVVQVKRETDGKAPADHGHEGLESTLDELESQVGTLSESVEDLAADLDAGFENFEDVLEYLTETTDDLESKTSTLAQVLVDVRTEVKRLSAREARRAEAEALQLAANRQGVESAKCDVCETEVSIALLTVPECPHCASTFNDVEKRSGLFSSNQLVTGDPPALPEAEDGLDGDDDLAAELADTAEADDE